MPSYSCAGMNSARCLLSLQNLPLEADNLFMYETFSPYGAILSVKVLVNEETGETNGRLFG